MIPYNRARTIIDRGGSILLPFEAGDGEFRFSCRRELCRLITEAIEEAIKEEEEKMECMRDK